MKYNTTAVKYNDSLLKLLTSLTELLDNDDHVEDGVAVGVLGVGVGALLDQDVVHCLVAQTCLRGDQ